GVLEAGETVADAHARWRLDPDAQSRWKHRIGGGHAGPDREQQKKRQSKHQIAFRKGVTPPLPWPNRRRRARQCKKTVEGINLWLGQLGHPAASAAVAPNFVNVPLAAPDGPP